MTEGQRPDPVARLARTLAAHDAPAHRASDDVLAVVADPDGPARTGLTWGDLRALHAELTACDYCLRGDCGRPDVCGGELDTPETEETT